MKRLDLEVAYGKRRREVEELRGRLGQQAVEIGTLRELVER
jgi:hypothetical protein